MTGLNVILFLVLIAGHTELIVMFLNRMHARRIRCGTLRRLGDIHDILILLFPVLLVWYAGISGPGLLVGGSWADLPAGWGVVFALCLVGFGGLCFSVLRSLLYRVPQTQISNHSQTIDIEKNLGFTPLGDGPYRFLAKLPGNEIFRIEVSEKRYQHPDLPQEWDGLSILHLTDFHFTGTIDRPFFEQVIQLSADMEPDLIVFTGDLLDCQELVDWLPATLGQLSAPLGQYFVLGNHDWYLQPDEIRIAMSDIGWTDVAGKTFKVDHSRFQKTEASGKRQFPVSQEQPGEISRSPIVVGGSESPWMGSHPDFTSVPENAFRVLLSHTPDNLLWAKQQHVDVMMSGHNHGGQVVLPIIGPVYSPSRYGVRYASGAFWDDPTLLYVSRGISSRHPLRYRCPPELTKLVFESGS
jgi:predicted MPP superfamily phosphohydrolase